VKFDAQVTEVLSRTRVLEFTTLTGAGGVSTRPMAGVWFDDREEIVLTTPAAYSRKVLDIRRDGRVALLYSDPAGSGLSDMPVVSVQGMATAPDVVVPPQELERYWRGVLSARPPWADATGDPFYRYAMGWFYTRLPIFVRPLRVDVLEPAAAGGAWRPPPPDGAAMNERISDALTRYPTAVLAARDRHGAPCSTRALVSWTDAGTLRLRPARPFDGTPGPADLLWHRHDGRAGDLASLRVTGTVTEIRGEWTLTPGTAASGEPPSQQEWLADGQRRTQAYLAERGITPPDVDWEALTAVKTPPR
jgi:general stress protein 26